MLVLRTFQTRNVNNSHLGEGKCDDGLSYMDMSSHEWGVFNWMWAVTV